MDKTAKIDTDLRFEMTREELAALGRGEVAYVRAIDVDQVKDMIGQEADVPAEAEFYCLYLADGTPVSISGSREAAVASAEQHDLMTISVH
ncbi:MAG: DUF1150 domain-containing protein [Hyphomicrobiales bacterium]|nr:DUF1150 domain-containing protein [Hyphomicrobiales bacterium]